MNSEAPICVIEDNVPIRKLFCTLLNKSGYTTVGFGEGKPAIEWLQQNNPQCVIVDILLPDKNGPEILKAIRDVPEGNKIPVIAATGFAHSNDRQNFLEMGFDSYISKPINTSSFVADIKKIIEEKEKNS